MRRFVASFTGALLGFGLLAAQAGPWPERQVTLIEDMSQIATP